MDRKLARKNIRLALLLGTVAALIFAATFVAGAVYVQ